VQVVALATEGADPLVSRVRQDRRGLRARHRALREGKRNSPPALQEGREQGGGGRPLIDAAAREGGEGKVVLIGIAQEKASVWRSWPAKGQEKAPHPHMEWGRQMAFVNHYYV